MKRSLFVCIGLITLAWFSGLFSDPRLAAASAPWVLRQEALYLSGLLSFGLMSVAMVLATKPAWLETPFGGLDRIYRLHKWAGIAAVGFGALHWLVELSDDVLKAWVGRSGRVPKLHDGGVLEMMRHFGKDLGEWAIYAVLLMLVISLWKRFPYQIWRYLHRVMPLLYLMLAIHAVFLAPVQYWTQPVGALLALLTLAGTIASVVSLTGSIGRSRRHTGVIEEVRPVAAGITEVVCRLPQRLKNYHPGQFAFVTFGSFEGAHPFTIAGVDDDGCKLVFQIKALGDYTGALASHLQCGQPVTLQGPYGRFTLRRASARKRQIWIAGGIGVTPFLAWLEALQATPQATPEADLYYSVRDSARDPFVARLKALCASLPGIRLHVQDTDRDGALNLNALQRGAAPLRKAEIWFCGPQAFADTLRAALRRSGARGVRFHQEMFEMR